MLFMCIHSCTHANGAKLVHKRDAQFNTEESP